MWNKAQVASRDGFNSQRPTDKLIGGIFLLCTYWFSPSFLMHCMLEHQRHECFANLRDVNSFRTYTSKGQLKYTMEKILKARTIGTGKRYQEPEHKYFFSCKPPGLCLKQCALRKFQLHMTNICVVKEFSITIHVLHFFRESLYRTLKVLQSVLCWLLPALKFHLPVRSPKKS